MAKSQTTAADPAYQMRRPGRPKKSEAKDLEGKDSESKGEAPTEQAKEEGGSLRFEMRLPPGVVADLELMRENTGNTFAGYIRQAIVRALNEDKKNWMKG